MTMRTIHPVLAAPDANGSRKPQTRNSRSLPTDHTPETDPPTDPPRINPGNAIDALSCAARQSAVISDKVKQLIHTTTRHGDLQVARSAALQLIEALDVMIAIEENA